MHLSTVRIEIRKMVPREACLFVFIMYVLGVSIKKKKEGVLSNVEVVILDCYCGFWYYPRTANSTKSVL